MEENPFKILFIDPSWLMDKKRKNSKGLPPLTREEVLQVAKATRNVFSGIYRPDLASTSENRKTAFIKLQSAYEALKDADTYEYWRVRHLRSTASRTKTLEETTEQLVEVENRLLAIKLEFIQSMAVRTNFVRHQAFPYRTLWVSIFETPCRILVEDTMSSLAIEAVRRDSFADGKRPSEGKITARTAPKLPVSMHELEIASDGSLTLHTMREVRFNPDTGMPEDVPRAFVHVSSNPNVPSTKWVRTSSSPIPGTLIGAIDLNEVQEVKLEPTAWSPAGLLSSTAGAPDLQSAREGYPLHRLSPYQQFLHPEIWEAGGDRRSLLVVAWKDGDEFMARLVGRARLIHVDETVIPFHTQ